jgi:hypothetical protein
MNLQCPNCQKMLNIDDKFAGQLMRCPLCDGTFTAPVLPATSPSGSPSPSVPLAAPVGSPSTATREEVFSLAPSSPSPLPPPGSESKSEKQSATSVTDASASGSLPPDASDYRHRYIIWISPRVVPWIAPMALTLVFFLLFFPWRSVPSTVVSLIPGEPESQIGWAKLFSSALLVFYFLIYLLALAMAVGSLLLSLKVVPCPPQIQHLLPWKAVIIAAAVAFAYLLILISCWTEDFGTVWFRTAVCLHLLALGGLALEFWLQRRGPTRPMPRIDVQW